MERGRLGPWSSTTLGMQEFGIEKQRAALHPPLTQPISECTSSRPVRSEPLTFLGLHDPTMF